MANKEGIAMYEFFEYVLDQLKNSLILALLALFAAGVVLLVAWLIHRAKFHGERKFPLVKALLLIALVGYSVIVLYATILRFSGGYREVNFHLFRAWREAWNSFSPKNWANVLLNVAMFAACYLETFQKVVSGHFCWTWCIRGDRTDPTCYQPWNLRCG